MDRGESAYKEGLQLAHVKLMKELRERLQIAPTPEERRLIEAAMQAEMADYESRLAKVARSLF